mmetsp:Transcript_22292/g.28834  ORF Transcript_22292/g.28834 Transcript_22292/m.28834 type:complete len:127 (+) Transcript_22292:41-421(+)
MADDEPETCLEPDVKNADELEARRAARRADRERRRKKQEERQEERQEDIETNEAGLEEVSVKLREERVQLDGWSSRAQDVAKMLEEANKKIECELAALDEESSHHNDSEEDHLYKNHLPKIAASSS